MRQKSGIIDLSLEDEIDLDESSSPSNEYSNNSVIETVDQPEIITKLLNQAIVKGLNLMPNEKKELQIISKNWKSRKQVLGC